MIMGHFDMLHAQPRYSTCHVRVFIESNMSWIDSERIAKYFEKPEYSWVNCMREDPSSGGKYGIWTSKDTKEGYVIEIQRSIDLLQFAHVFISEKKEASVQALIEQLRSFRREVIAPASDSGASLHYKVALTGKSSGKKDDLVMALGIALYYMQSMQRNQRFLDFCRQRGITSS